MVAMALILALYTVYKLMEKRRLYLVLSGDINKFLCVFSFIHQLFVARTVTKRKREKLKKETESSDKVRRIPHSEEH